MFQDRSLKLDVIALALLAVSVFLGVALVTYDRTDPPSTLVYPPSEVVHNACGASGAYVAHHLLDSMGVGAYYLAMSLVAFTVLLLMRREIDQPVVRSTGWAVSLVGLSTLAALAVPNFTPGPIVGPGGYIGAMGRNLLEQHFAVAGSFIFAIAVLMAGLLLCTDYFIFRVAAVTTLFSGRGLATVGRISTQAARTAVRPKTDIESGIAFEDEEDEYEEEDEEEDDEYEYEEEDEDEEDHEPVPIKVRTPTAPAEPASAGGRDDDSSAGGENVGDADESTPTEVGSAGTSLANGLKSALGIKNKRNKKTPAPPFKPSKKSERDEIIEQLEAADHEQRDEHDYELPPLDLLLPPDEVSYDEHEREVRRKARILQKTFKNFGFNVKVVEIETGPVIAQYEIELEAGLRLSKITGLADDLAIALRVPSVRIVAPIPGKNTVGIEVPNEHRQIVRLREVIEEANGRAKRLNIPIFLGKDVSGNPLLVDLAALPHLLIAGRTGTGKSVCLNSIIVSMLMGRGPDEIRMLMIDPKMVELSGYQKLPHLMHPVVTDMRKAEAILAWAVDKMEERYQLLARAGVRHVSVFNQLGDDELRDRIRPNSEREWEEIPRQLPFIVIVADEIADLMMTAGKDVEQHIIRLAQKSRAVGIHLILATQKPTVDVITGLIKSNLPARIAFQVASRTDSRVVLDEMGAEKLLGNGDMLFLLPGTSTMLRGQGTYLSDDEISRVVDFVGTDDPQFAHELLDLKTKDEQDAAAAGDFKNRDELYEAAVDMVVRERRGSVSLLQRSLGIGYGRAARLIDFMAEDKIVGEYNGSQAREVLISLEDWEAMTNSAPGDEEAPSNAETTVTKPTKKPRRTNKIVPEIDEPSDLETEVDALAEADAPFDADEEDADEEDAEEEDAEEEDEDEEWEDDDEVDEDEEEADDEDDDEEWEYEEVDESDEEELADDEEWVYEDDEEEEDEEVDEELEDEYEDEEELADQA